VAELRGCPETRDIIFGRVKWLGKMGCRSSTPGEGGKGTFVRNEHVERFQETVGHISKVPSETAREKGGRIPNCNGPDTEGVIASKLHADCIRRTLMVDGNRGLDGVL